MTDDQFGCLVNQWYNRRFKNEPIVLRVINDNQAYADFFTFICNQATDPASLAPIDFSKNSLLIGTKADYGEFINTPVNVRQITQVLKAGSNGTYALEVTVVGEASKQSHPGSEWFAFVSVVPKLTSTVTLDMHYQFN